MVEKVVQEKEIPTIRVTDSSLRNGGFWAARTELMKHGHIKILYHSSIENARKLFERMGGKEIPTPSMVTFPYNHIGNGVVQDFALEVKYFRDQR